MARAGGLVCRKIKLKKLCDPKTAGGCGVVTFLSATRLFCLRVAAPAKRGGRDPFDGLRDSGVRGGTLTARYSAHGLRVQKSPQDAGCGMGSANYVLVLAAGLPYLCSRLQIMRSGMESAIFLKVT